jgi:GNAT superfamily N-acetyltransferase
MNDLRIEEVRCPNPELLTRIGQLRVMAWATEIPQAAAMGEWLDEFEGCACHWVVFRGCELVAAARLSIHQSLADVPDPECFVGIFREPPPTPIASFNRLVVHPSARGFGLSRRLDEARLDFAEALGCRCAIGSTPSGYLRIRQMEEFGFVVVGLGNPDLRPPCCYGPRPVVVMCHLPRGSRTEQRYVEPSRKMGKL